MSYATDLRTFKADLGQLLEQHQGRRTTSDLSHYGDDIVGFARHELHVEPWEEMQVRALQAIPAHRRLVVRGAHSVGKDFLLSIALLWGIYVKGMLALAISATERQLVGQLMREVRGRFRSAPNLSGELFTSQLRIDGEPRLIGMTSGTVDNLTGWHDPAGVLVCISEGQGEQVEGVAYDAALSNATDELSRVVAVGNPVRPVGRFYTISRSGNWHAIRIAVTDHPNIRAGRMVVKGGPAPSWPAEMAAEYGENSPFYQSRVLGEFPEDSEEVLVQRGWLEAAAERFERGELQSPNAPAQLALDPARYGADMTMLAVRRGGVLVELGGWRQKSTMESAGRLLDRMRTLGVPTSGGLSLTYAPEPAVVIDEVGLGGGVVDRLKEQGVPVDAFNGGRSPTGKGADRFLNRRAQSFWHLRSLLERGLVAIPRDAELWEELLNTNWSPTSAGKIQIEAKDDIKARIGRSPDRADAVAMVFFNFGRQTPESLTSLQSSSYFSLGGVSVPTHEVGLGGYY